MILSNMMPLGTQAAEMQPITMSVAWSTISMVLSSCWLQHLFCGGSLQLNQHQTNWWIPGELPVMVDLTIVKCVLSNRITSHPSTDYDCQAQECRPKSPTSEDSNSQGNMPTWRAVMINHVKIGRWTSQQILHWSTLVIPRMRTAGPLIQPHQETHLPRESQSNLSAAFQSTCESPRSSRYFDHQRLASERSEINSLMLPRCESVLSATMNRLLDIKSLWLVGEKKHWSPASCLSMLLTVS